MFNVIEKEKINLARNLSVMLKSGVTLFDALVSIEKQSGSKKFKEALRRVKDKVEHGTSLSEAFRAEGRVFSGVFSGLIEVGESSGTLAENCNYLADWLEVEYDLKQGVKAATLYPKIILTAALLLGLGLSVFILPRLMPLFLSFGLDLPLSTRIIMFITTFLQEHFIGLVIFIVVSVVSSITLYRLKKVRLFIHTISLKIPIINTIIIGNQCAFFTKLFSTMLHSGFYVDDSINIIKNTMSNDRYKEVLHSVHERVQKGTSLSIALGEYPKLFSDNMIVLITVGEQTGNLEDSMENLSHYYMKEVINASKKLPIILEPILLICIGFIVGFVAISIVLPIYSLTSSIH